MRSPPSRRSWRTSASEATPRSSSGPSGSTASGADGLRVDAGRIAEAAVERRRARGAAPDDRGRSRLQRGPAARGHVGRGGAGHRLGASLGAARRRRALRAERTGAAAVLARDDRRPGARRGRPAARGRDAEPRRGDARRRPRARDRRGLRDRRRAGRRRARVRDRDDRAGRRDRRARERRTSRPRSSSSRAACASTCPPDRARSS